MMDRPTLESVDQRLDRLEWENRRLKRVGVVLLVGLSALPLMGQISPSKGARVIQAEQFVALDKEGHARAKVVEAERFVVVDKDGHTRAYLGDLPDSSPIFALTTKTGKPRVSLSVEADESVRLELLDPSNTQRF